MDWRIWIPVVGCVIHVGTLLACYGLTYHKQQGTRDWLLSLSTISEGDLESTIFTVGTAIAGAFYMITTLMRHHLLSRTLSYLERENLILLKSVRKLRVLSIISTCSGCLGSLSLCLSVLRKYVSWEFLFIMMPYIFFVTSMCINTLLGYMMKRRKTFFYFFILSICGFGFFVIAISFGLSDDRNMQVISVVASYIMVVTFARFISLYFHEFRNSNFMILDERVATNIYYGTPFTHSVSVNNNLYEEP